MSGRPDVPLPSDRLILTRRSLVKAGLLSAAALTVAVRTPAPARAVESDNAASAPGVYEFNRDWLFGGPYVSGGEAPGYSEAGFTAVTLPHTVTDLSWGWWSRTRRSSGMAAT
jgi:hypothetical protein